MKKIQIFFISIVSVCTIALLLRIPGTFTPTITALNTYTIAPLNASELPQQLSTCTIENFLHALKQQCAPESAIIAIENTHLPTHYCSITAGVPKNCARIAIYCRGYQKNMFKRVGNGMLLTYLHIKKGLLAMPCVAFDLPDDRALFNNGQDLDQLCLRTVYEVVLRNNPDAHITLIGDCRGGQTVLNFLAHTNAPAVDTLVLESPFATTQLVFKKIAQSYLQPYLGHIAYPLLRTFLHFVLPQYETSKDTLLSNVHAIHDKKIIISALVHDAVNPTDNLNDLITQLRKNNTVYVLPLDQADFIGPMPQHSRSYKSFTFANGVNAFYKLYGIPYDAHKANAGTHLLETAKTATIPTN